VESFFLERKGFLSLNVFGVAENNGFNATGETCRVTEPIQNATCLTEF
jgi:hypothetical protein